MQPRKLLASLLAITCVFAIVAFVPVDDDPITRIIAQLNKWTADNPQEKVYLHTDRPFYAAGEKIWFQAYVTIGTKHQLSALSSVLNVELISSRDSITKAIKIPIENGTSTGDLSLPDDLGAGIYHLRAYTNYMRNAGDEYIFDKTIAIGNNITDPVTSVPVKRSLDATGVIQPKIGDMDVQFFPEGGTLVTGLPSRVAFKAVVIDGAGINIKGTVVDEQNNQVASFTEEHMGMGVFFFTPESGKTYKAVVTNNGGVTVAYPLPVAVENGYSLAVNNIAPDKVTVKIAAGDALGSVRINLVAQQNGQVCYAAKPMVDKSGVAMIIPKNRFATGIVQFTLFSASGEPLNERIAFIQNPDLLKLNISSEKQQYGPRQKVTININANDGSLKPVTGTFSVAVIDEKKVPVDETMETTILTSLLLSSDIKGNIEKPNYYFTDINNQTRADLDALMLTQGYRRFAWKKILSDSTSPQIFGAEDALSISGSVKTAAGKPLQKGKVTITSTGGGFFEADTLTDDKGRFTFKNLFFADSTKFIVQAIKQSGGRNVIIELDKSNRPLIKYAEQTTQTAIQGSMTVYLQSSIAQHVELLQNGIIRGGKSIMLKDVSVVDKTTEAVKYSDNLNGPGRANQILTHEDLKQYTCAHFLDCLAQLINGITLRLVKQADGSFRPQLFSTRTATPVQRPMLLMVDGVPSSYDDIQYLNSEDVLSIEVLRNAAYSGAYGAVGGPGVLVITTINNTKRPVGNWGERFEKRSPDVVVYTPLGYYRAREFYSPKYDDPKTSAPKPDLRSTIFWKPNLLTGADGNASFSFFNADGVGTYKVVVEGIDKDGNLGRQVYRYKVL